jgi:cytochrome c-type biogenesis protein CcmH
MAKNLFIPEGHGTPCPYPNRDFGRGLVRPTQTILLFWVLLLLTSLAAAQDAQPTPVISDDQVNAIASGLYCPVCENIPLDACGTAACDDWRYEIQLQLEAGMTEQQIVDDFVRRFGDRVVGTPQDPLLRAISLVTPYAVMGVALIAVLVMFANWQRQKPKQRSASAALPIDRYEAQIEQDLAG